MRLLRILQKKICVQYVYLICCVIIERMMQAYIHAKCGPTRIRISDVDVVDYEEASVDWIVSNSDSDSHASN